MTFAVLLSAAPALAAVDTLPATQPQPATGRPVAVPGAAFTLDLARQLAEPQEPTKSSHRRETLQKTVDAAETPVDEAAAHLALANWLLAVPAARPATRWLIGLPATEDLRVIAESSLAAHEHIDRARTLLKAEPSGGNDRRRDLRTAAGTLDAFATLFSAAAGDQEKKKVQSGCEQAAVALASARESEDPAIAASALLWQSFGWYLAGRPERALTSLPDALQKPQQLEYDFMSRLLRCRILSEANQQAGAIALTIRMRAVCSRWSRGEKEEVVDSKRRLIAWLQCRIGKGWLEQLRTKDGPSAARLEGVLAGVQKNVFAADPPLPVYHLESAIPIIVEPPVLKPRATTLSAPAAAPPSSKPTSAATKEPPITTSPAGAP